MSINRVGGFSLVELLISSVVLSIGALGLIKLQSSLRMEYEQLQLQQEALYLLRQKQQDLMAAAIRLSDEQQLEYLSITDNTGGRQPAGALQEWEQSKHTTEFERYWQVRAKNWLDSDADGVADAWQPGLNPDGYSHIKTTSVTIKWKDAYGQSQSVTQQSTVAPMLVMSLERIVTLGEQAKRTPD